MQKSLFGVEELCAIPGLRYQEDFVTAQEEQTWIEVITSLPLQAAQYKQYQAHRRTISFNGSYDFDANRLLPGLDLDERLLPLRAKVAAWAGMLPVQLRQTLVAEYLPGTPLGWHRDVPDFENVIGVSLGSSAALRFRPYPPEPTTSYQPLQLDVAPRSIYLLSGEARWDWQHCVVPTKALRWSITFRSRMTQKLQRP